MQECNCKLTKKTIEVQLQLATFDINLKVPSTQHIQWKLHTAKISVVSQYIVSKFKVLICRKSYKIKSVFS